MRKVIIILGTAFAFGLIFGGHSKYKEFKEAAKQLDKAIELARLEYEFATWFFNDLYDEEVTYEQFHKDFHEKQAYIETIRGM